MSRYRLPKSTGNHSGCIVGDAFVTTDCSEDDTFNILERHLPEMEQALYFHQVGSDAWNLPTVPVAKMLGTPQKALSFA